MPGRGYNLQNNNQEKHNENFHMLTIIRKSIIRLSAGWRNTLLIKNEAKSKRLCTSTERLYKTKEGGAVVVVIVWSLNLQRPMQSVPINTNVVSSKPAHGEAYSLQHYVIKCVSDLWQVGGFLRVLGFPTKKKKKKKKTKLTKNSQLTATILLNYCWE